MSTADSRKRAPTSNKTAFILNTLREINKLVEVLVIFLRGEVKARILMRFLESGLRTILNAAT